jgi:hypothetical protein
MIKNNRRIMVIALICIFLIGSQSVGFAQGAHYKKTLEAWYNTAKIIVNGKEMSSQVKPFIVDGTTYVPLRTMANIFDKDIKWDTALQSVVINDKPNNSIQNLRNQIITKDIEINQLKNKIKKLEEEAKTSGKDMDDLEDELNDDYDRYKSCRFKVKLSGDKDDVNVNIEIDLGDYKDEWDDLDNDDIKKYLQDIVDDILDEYDDADIEGTIEDTDDDEDIVEFDVSSSGRVSMEKSLADLEDTLDHRYDDYFSHIELSVELSGDTDDIEYKINVEYDKYESRWDDLTSSEIEDLMEKVYDDIDDEYGRASIKGYIYDEDNHKNLYKYYETSTGHGKFTEY